MGRPCGFRGDKGAPFAEHQEVQPQFFFFFVPLLKADLIVIFLIW